MEKIDLTRIKINEECIQIISKFDNRVVFTIWRDEFDMYKECFKKCQDYNDDIKEVRSKYNG